MTLIVEAAAHVVTKYNFPRCDALIAGIIKRPHTIIYTKCYGIIYLWPYMYMEFYTSGIVMGRALWVLDSDGWQLHACFYICTNPGGFSRGSAILLTALLHDCTFNPFEGDHSSLDQCL